MAEGWFGQPISRHDLPKSTIIIDISLSLASQLPNHNVFNPKTWIHITEENIPDYDGAAPLPYFGAYDDQLFSKYMQKHHITSDEAAAEIWIYYPLNLGEWGEKVDMATPGEMAQWQINVNGLLAENDPSLMLPEVGCMSSPGIFWRSLISAGLENRIRCHDT